MDQLPGFDMTAFYDALDAERRRHDLDWYQLAAVLWDQSREFNQIVIDHPLCGGALSRMRARGTTSCQYALYGLRWLGRPPEDFLTGPSRAPGDTSLPDAGPGQRLRFDLPELHAALNERRRTRGLTWADLATDLGCTPARLTNLRHAREADVHLTIEVTQWLGRPAADFVHPTEPEASSREICADG